MRCSRDFVKQAMKQHSRALKYASKDILTDHEIVLEAVKANGGALKYAAHELKTDPSLVTEVLRHRLNEFEFANLDDDMVRQRCFEARGEKMSVASPKSNRSPPDSPKESPRGRKVTLPSASKPDVVTPKKANPKLRASFWTVPELLTTTND